MQPQAEPTKMERDFGTYLLAAVIRELDLADPGWDKRLVADMEAEEAAENAA